MRIRNFEFRPRLIPTLATLVILPVLLSLGVWQLNRAEEKRVLLAERGKKEHMPALDITGQAEHDLSELEFRKLRVVGRFDSNYVIYIDNKVYQGKVGYQVVEPLVLQPTQEAILVNRGWVAATASRADLPEISHQSSEQTIYGIAKFDTRDVASLGAGNRSGEDWPALVRWIDIAELQKSMPFKLKPYLLLQTNDNGDGLLREWMFVSSPPEKNQSYAIQWFSLAAALVLIFIFVNTKKIVR